MFLRFCRPMCLLAGAKTCDGTQQATRSLHSVSECGFDDTELGVIQRCTVRIADRLVDQQSHAVAFLCCGDVPHILLRQSQHMSRGGNAVLIIRSLKGV